ncbi:hypothetical protein AMTR_s00060p00169850, partial [Amborella trichopoda]
GLVAKSNGSVLFPRRWLIEKRGGGGSRCLSLKKLPRERGHRGRKGGIPAGQTKERELLEEENRKGGRGQSKAATFEKVQREKRWSVKKGIWVRIQREGGTGREGREKGGWKRGSRQKEKGVWGSEGNDSQEGETGDTWQRWVAGACDGKK